MTKIKFNDAIREAGNDRFIISPRSRNPYICFYTPCRIDKDTVPKHWYIYEIRTDDTGAGIPITVENHVTVNFGGSLLSPHPIKFSKGKSYLNIYNNRWGRYKYTHV